MAATKVVVITGASAGIGEAIAQRMKTCRLVLVARRQGELERVAQAVGGEPLVVVADVTRQADVERAKDEALARFGRVDVWINNAGRGIVKPALALTEADVDDMMLVNVKSALWGMQAILPHMMARGDGHVLNISSFLSKIPIASVRSMYSAAKAALNSLASNVRADLAPTHPNVHITTVLPGIVLTEFGKNAGGPPSGSAPPANPAMKPQTAPEVADVVARAIDAPGAAEVYTNPGHAAFFARYVEVGGDLARLARG